MLFCFNRRLENEGTQTKAPKRRHPNEGTQISTEQGPIPCILETLIFSPHYQDSPQLSIDITLLLSREVLDLSLVTASQPRQSRGWSVPLQGFSRNLEVCQLPHVLFEVESQHLSRTHTIRGLELLKHPQSCLPDSISLL